jgi:hypothetical protein
MTFVIRLYFLAASRSGATDAALGTRIDPLILYEEWFAANRQIEESEICP